MFVLYVCVWCCFVACCCMVMVCGLLLFMLSVYLLLIVICVLFYRHADMCVCSTWLSIGPSAASHTPDLPTKIIPTKIAWLKLSGKSRMGPGISRGSAWVKSSEIQSLSMEIGRRGSEASTIHVCLMFDYRFHDRPRFTTGPFAMTPFVLCSLGGFHATWLCENRCIDFHRAALHRFAPSFRLATLWNT